ncbi:MAG: prepilin-type N-terminal cleavage/methylation domain-containing protein [Akkermansia muciniphila]
MKTFAKIKSGAFTLIELLAAMTITTTFVPVIGADFPRGRYLEMGAAGCADHDACPHGHGYHDQGF